MRDALPILPLAEQTMAMPAIRRRWTTADVRALMDESRAWPRYELIDGELLVTPAPGGIHQVAVAEIIAILAPYAEGGGIGIVLPSPADLELKPGTITQPDVFVVPAKTPMAGEMLQWPDVKSLTLAVEIISPSSMKVDRTEKRDFYMEARVAEYWIVDLDARIVERWTPEQVHPEIRRDTLSWRTIATAPLEIDLRALFARIDRKARLRL